MDSLPEIDLSIFVARVLGVIYLAVGFGLFLFRETYILALRKLVNPVYMMPAAFMAVVGGMALVSYHNLWVSDWRVIITIIGWIALIKGILLLLIPSYIMVFRNFLQVRSGMVLTIVILMAGAVFFYLGFF